MTNLPHIWIIPMHSGSAFLVIDMQNDFISGSLPVPGAEDIIDMVEDLAKMDIWYQVWGHHHFQRNTKYNKYSS